MLAGDAVDCIAAADVDAALSAGDLGRVLQLVTLGSSSWADEANVRGRLVKECSADGECFCGAQHDCPLRRNAQLAQRALGELGRRAAAGQLPLAPATLGSMQLLALLREALRWRQIAAGDAFAALASSPGAPRMRLSWCRGLLLSGLRSSVPEQLPALQRIIALCNEAAAREGQPALPPSPHCRSLSALDAAYPQQRRQHAAAPFPALAEILATATGIAEHVRIEDLCRACSHGCLAEVLRLGPPPSPAASQLAWDKVLQWGACTLHMRMQAAEARGATSAHDWALPVYVRVADALDALLAAGHRPQQLWGVQLGLLHTPAQQLAAYRALLAARTQPLLTLNWLAALAASGLEWSPSNHRHWPPAIQAAVRAAFGPAIFRPAPRPKGAAAAWAARAAGAAGTAGMAAEADAPSSEAAHEQAAGHLTAELLQLPADIQERIAGLVVRPISRWLPLEGGALGDTRLPHS